MTPVSDTIAGFNRIMDADRGRWGESPAVTDEEIAAMILAAGRRRERLARAIAGGC